MTQITRIVGLTVPVTISVEDPSDEDAVEEALAEEGAKVLHEQYGVGVRAKDIVIINEGGYEEDEDASDIVDEFSNEDLIDEGLIVVSMPDEDSFRDAVKLFTPPPDRDALDCELYVKPDELTHSIRAALTDLGAEFGE